MVYKAEFYVSSEWRSVKLLSGEAMTFPTREEAANHAKSLALRWTWRIVEAEGE